MVTELDIPAPPPHLSGLTSAEAAARLARDGPNRLTPPTRGQRLRRLLGPLADPMVLLLLIAAPTYLLVGETTDAIVAFVAIIPVAGVGWVLEARAERTLEALDRLSARRALVWRDEQHRTIPAEEVVAGDLVWIHEGDIVPADATVVDASQLQVDESALTGESLPVAKAVTGFGEDDTVWAGTTVVSGRAIARVTATGAATRYGAIGGLVAGGGPGLTPFQRAIGRLVRLLAVMAAAFSVAVMVATLLHGEGWVTQ
jgi:Ca2+-transporting ATPase